MTTEKLITKRQRGLKTTSSQFEAFLNELRTNEPFRDNTFDASDPDILKRTWEQLSAKVKALGGPCRDVSGWKRVFCDWKSQTRAKARKLRLSHFETGNIGVPPKPLTDLEEQLLELTGRVAITGMENVHEIGIDGPLKPAKSQLLNIGDDKENVMKNSDGEPNQILTSATKIRAPRRKTSLIGYLENLTQESSASDNNRTVELLGDIAKEMKLRRKIENKKLKIEIVKLRLKYPEHDFIFDTSDSE